MCVLCMCECAPGCLLCRDKVWRAAPHTSLNTIWRNKVRVSSSDYCTLPAPSLSVPLQTQWALTVMALTLLANPKVDHRQSSLRLWLHPSSGWCWENYSVLVCTSSSGLAGLGPGSRRMENKVYSLVQTDLLKLCLVYPFCPLSLSSSFNPPVNP